MLTPRNVLVTWDQSPSPNVTGYLILYTTTISYAIDGNVTVNGSSNISATLTDLEENTPYTITVRATNNSGMSGDSNAVSVTTYTASK